MVSQAISDFLILEGGISYTSVGLLDNPSISNENTKYVLIYGIINSRNRKTSYDIKPR